MPSGPVFSEKDKEKLREELKELCEHCWTLSGYKKTGVKELCDKAGISIGTFYVLYPTKEDLFFETVRDIQERLKERFLDSCQSEPAKEGFARAMKEMAREYSAKPVLYDVSKPDYQSFVRKLPKEAMEKIKIDSVGFFATAVGVARLKLKIDEYQAYGVFSALLSTIFSKETLCVTCDYFSVFDFMVDSLIPNIFE